MNTDQQQKAKGVPTIIKNIDHYVIFDEQLGFGQFSQVHRAMDKNEKCHNIYYACKIIPFAKIPISQKPQYRELLQKEIDILRSAKHPNLIQLYDMKQSSNNVYLFLDFCNGGDLKQYLNKKGGRLSEIQATQFFKEIVSGYKVLHEKNIIHRDIKPENIMLNNGVVKIGDFGFARIISGDMNQAQRMTQKCSPLYAPPQLLENKEYSSKCDVWSTGVLFYEMLYGQPPFIAQSMNGLVENIIEKTLKNEFQFPQNILISDQAKDIIQKMLQYNETDRISWDQVFNHPILNLKLQKSRILDFELNKSKDNAINKSFEKHLTQISSENYKIVSEQNYLQMEFEQQSGMEEEREGNEEEVYGNYMVQIKKQEKKNYLIQLIDSYLNFIRNQSLFANTALLNFWNAFQLNEQIESATKCQILICLCGYYNYYLQAIKRMLSGEVAQNTFSPLHFNVYKNSVLCLKMQELINNDALEAELLYKDLFPLCYSEITMKISQNQNTPRAAQLTQFLQNVQNYVNTMAYESFRNEFKVIISSYFGQLQIENEQLFDKDAIKSLYMLVIFSFLEKFFDIENHQHFDFNKFYDDQLNNKSTQELRNIIIQFRSQL